MSEIKHTQKKNILADPVTHLMCTEPTATEEKITTVTKLQQHYLTLKEQLKAEQKHCKKISRHIGKAKNEGLSTSQLKQDMRSHSENISTLKAQLNDAAEMILNYFETTPNVDDATQPPLELLTARIHTNKSTTNQHISITLLQNENEKWNRYIDSNPSASAYHRAEWKDLINDAFGHKGYYFHASINEEIVGILPLIRLKSKLFGDFMTSMPYFNYGGAIADNLAIEQKLIQAANNHAKKIGVSHVEYRDDIAREELPSRTEKVNMILPLPASHNELWSNFTSKLRSQIKRAQREQVQITLGGTECLNDFYTVFAKNMRDLGTPVYAKSFFSKILQCYAENSKIIVVHFENRPVAAGFLLANKVTLEIPWASTIKDVNHLSMNMLLYWEVLKFATEKNYQYFDFGRSSKNSGTFRFKQQWGAKPKQLYWHYWLSEKAELPKLNPDNPKFALAIKIWKQLPIWLTKLIGPAIVKNLP